MSGSEGEAAPPSVPMLAAHHRFAAQVKCQVPTPSVAAGVLEMGSSDYENFNEGVNEKMMQMATGHLHSAGFGLPTDEQHAYYCGTSSDSDFIYGQEDAIMKQKLTERRERDRKAILAEQARVRKVRMQCAMAQLVSTLPQPSDHSLETIVSRACEYIEQLSASAENAYCDNIRLKAKIKQLTEEESLTERSSVADIPKPDFNEALKAALKGLAPVFWMALVLSAVISPRRLARTLWSWDPGQAVEKFFSNRQLFSVPVVHRGINVFSVVAAVIAVLVMRRVKKIFAVLGYSALAIIPDEQPTVVQPKKAQHRSHAPPLPPPSAAPGFHHPLKKKAQSKVMEYLHSEGIAARGRIVPETYQRRRTTSTSTFNNNTHGHAAGRAPYARSRTLSSASYGQGHPRMLRAAFGSHDDF